MKKTRCSALVALVMPFLVRPAGAQTGVEVRLRVSEDVEVVGDLHRAAAPDGAPAILLFHQGGGDARAEYADIIPRLLGEGFHVLSTDVRGGGTRFGGTPRASPVGPDFRYCSAFADVEAALSMARQQGLTGPVILWGSSYTATLVVQLGARRTADVRAVLSFSPAGGEPLSECEADVFSPWLLRAGVPLLVVRSSAELEVPGVRERLERLEATGARTVVANGSGHGSSMLVPARFQGDVAPLWSTVLDFLRAARTAPPAAPGTPVSITSDGWILRGDLVLPRGATRPAPLALLLNKAAGSRAVYADLARGLAERGIASLRLDLRGHGESTNLGRFIPYVPGVTVGDEHADVERALAFARARPDLDGGRIAIVSGSYSSETVATALRSGSRARAVVALSPGSFSDSSFAAIGTDGAEWLFVRSDAERFVGEWLDDRLRAHAPDTELWVLRAGPAHATDLLLADPTLSGRLADWLAQRLH